MHSHLAAKKLRRTSVLAAAILAACVTAPLVAEAAPKPSTVVILGDSFASGEAGRWSGNSFTGIDGGNRAGTDRAALYGYPVAGRWNYNLDIPYLPASIGNGCDRSEWAPGTWLQNVWNQYSDGYDQVINLACSGARGKNLWPPALGGTALKGESPQIPRLAAVAAQHDIDLVVVGIGGNDMGFADAVKECALAWIYKHWTPDDDNSCIDEIRDHALPKLGDAWYVAARSVDQVKKQMAAIGDSDYRIVLTGYPAIIPDGNGFSYSAGMRRVRNCPFNGPDADYVEDVLMPKLNATMEAVAHQENVDFVNLHHAFDGHRLCEAGFGSRVTHANAPTSRNTEWVRYLDTTASTANAFAALILKWAKLANGVVIDHIAGDQGSLAESLHPNEFGQRAIGQCLREVKAASNSARAAFACEPGASGYASDMDIDALPEPATLHSASNHAIPDGGALNVHRTLSAATEPGRVMRSEIRITHARKGHLKITVRSPSGREYLVRDINPGDTGAFPSVSKNFFFDAPVENGSWTLRIEDRIAGVSGTLTDWKLFFF